MKNENAVIVLAMNEAITHTLALRGAGFKDHFLKTK